MIQTSTIMYKTVGFSKKKDLNKLVLWSKEWLLPFNIVIFYILVRNTSTLNIVWLQS